MGLAREVLAGLAESVALSREQYDDMRTAVTEACNNVVQHAYRDGVGPMDMEVLVVRDAVEVLVRDAGVGMVGIAEEGAGELEIGLPVMLTLAERLQVEHAPEGGTEVQMRFGVPGVEAAAGRHRLRDDEGGPPEIVLPGVDASVRVAFSSTELAEAILPRIAVTLAARSHFSADRTSDVQIVADALASAAVPLAQGPILGVAFGCLPRELRLQVGPLHTGGTESLDSSRLRVVERLVDERTVTAIGPGEVLLLRMRDKSRHVGSFRGGSRPLDSSL